MMYLQRVIGILEIKRTREIVGIVDPLERKNQIEETVEIRIHQFEKENLVEMADRQGMIELTIGGTKAEGMRKIDMTRGIRGVRNIYLQTVLRRIGENQRLQIEIGIESVIWIQGGRNQLGIREIRGTRGIGIRIKTIWILVDLLLHRILPQQTVEMQE
jgi:hypothetical protein